MIRDDKKIIILIIGIIITPIVINIYYNLYYNHNHNLIIPCIFNKITGLYCPGCGITRMIFSIFKLEIYQAFRYNPLVFCMVPFILFYFIDMVIKWIKGDNNYLYQKINDKVWLILLIITITFGVLRNIPLFKFLIPTIIK